MPSSEAVLSYGLDHLLFITFSKLPCPFSEPCQGGGGNSQDSVLSVLLGKLPTLLIPWGARRRWTAALSSWFGLEWRDKEHDTAVEGTESSGQPMGRRQGAHALGPLIPRRQKAKQILKNISWEGQSRQARREKKKARLGKQRNHGHGNHLFHCKSALLSLPTA